MSGPKVVRILTREERMAPSLKLLNTLRNTIARCEEQCRNEGDIKERELLGFATRIHELTEKVRAADQFTDLERAISAEISFVQDKQEEGLRAQVEKRAQKRIYEYLSTYMREFLTGQAEYQKELHAEAQKTADLTEEQQRILSQFYGSLETPSVYVWHAAAKAIPEPVTRLERTMAELEVLHPPTAHLFDVRLAALHEQASGLKRDMVWNSLLLELSGAVKEQKILAQAIADLEDLISQRALDTALAEAAAKAIETRNIVTIRYVHDSITAAIKKMEDEEFTTLRRNSILEGLAELGYGKGMDMATVVEKNGRIILREDAQSSYGIEIAGALSPRMQIRVVSFSENHSPEADLDAETVWCGHMATLQEKIRQDGTVISIEMARKAGEVPIKTVPTENIARNTMQKRTLRQK